VLAFQLASEPDVAALEDCVMARMEKKTLKRPDELRAFDKGQVELVTLGGRIRVRMDDGSEDEFDPGDVSLLSPDHDAWS
jgi:hypothetical protein